MRVAIIGAGLAGLSCALELEKRGISPVLFEKKSRIGEWCDFSGIWSRLVIRINQDPIEYLKAKYDLDIKPLSRLNESMMISKRKKIVARGNLGYTFIRGGAGNSLENQIASKIKSPIHFNSYMQPDLIKSEFDRIIVADSCPDAAKHMGIWTDTFSTRARVATVLGNFRPGSTIAWFNENYSNKAFSYLIPNSTKEASLVLLVNNCSIAQINYYWDKFLKIEKIKHIILQQNDMVHFCGFVKPLQVDNISFVGNAAGLTDDLIGIGGFNAIESGILAAQAIAEGLDYNQLVQPIYDDIVKLHHFRNAMNHFDNASFDKMLTIVGLPGIKQFVSKAPFLKLRHILPLVKLYNKVKTESNK